MNLPEFLIDHPDGEIRLTGHRIGLFHVISYHKDGESPEALYERFPTLSLDLIQKVIAFYHENQPEVDAYVADYQAEIDRQRASAPQVGPSLEELRRRMATLKQGLRAGLPDFLIDSPDGEIRLTGHRISLYTVIRVHKEGQSPEEIHETFPTLSVELVRKVIAFYHENRAAVDAYVFQCQADLERLEASHPPSPGVLKLRRLLEATQRTEAH